MRWLSLRGAKASWLRCPYIAALLAAIILIVVVETLMLGRRGSPPVQGTPPDERISPSSAPQPNGTSLLTNDRYLSQVRADLLSSSWGTLPADALIGGLVDRQGGSLETTYLMISLRKAECLPLIEAKLRQGTPYEKRMVTKLLRYIGWSESVPALIKIIQSDTENPLARIGALYALSAIGEPSAGPATAKVITDSLRSATEHRIALATMGRLRYRDGIPLVRPFLTHRDSLVRLYAALSLLLLGEHPPLDEPVRLTSDSDYVVRREACSVLGFSNDEQAKATLADIAKTDPDEAVRAEARIASSRLMLAQLPSLQQRAAYVEQLITGSDKRVTSWALAELAYECGEPGRLALAKTCEESSRIGQKSLFHLLILPNASPSFHGAH